MSKARIGVFVFSVFLILAVSAFSQTTTLSGLHLASTTLQVADAFQPVGASCAEDGCTATTPVVTPTTVSCPGPAGTPCTFKVHADVYNLAWTTNAIVALQFVGDGSETPFQAGSAPLAAFAGASGQPVVFDQASATFVLKVTNQYRGQRHRVEVDLVCREEIISGGGCTVVAFPSTLNAGDQPGPPAALEIAVYR